MRNLQTIAIAVMLAIAGGIVLGVWAGIELYAGTETRLMREEAIAYGVARYNPQSGEFEFRIDMRTPLEDYAPWRRCPLCGGEGVMPLPPSEPAELVEPAEPEEQSKAESGDWL